MIRKFKNWLISLGKLFKRREIQLIELPQIITSDERLCRAIFSPINIDKKSGKLKSNAFRTPSEKDEISVNRLNYTFATFCKVEAKRNENSNQGRSYFGLAIIYQHEVESSDCETVYTPITKPKEKRNPFHADIRIGYIPKKGEELPSRFRKKVDDMVKYSRFYPDPDTDKQNWTGSELI